MFLPFTTGGVMHFTTSVLSLCFGLAVATNVAIPQENLRIQLFGDTDKVLAQAREKKANLYGPTSFRRGMEYYADAEDDFKRGRNLEDIRAKLRGASSYFIKAIDACKLGEVTFTSVMAARTDAISADAPKYSTQLWNGAEAQFRDAAEELESGDVNGARKEGGAAETMYRNAELEAIKANYLTPARELLKKADDMDVRDNAPQTLEKARKLSGQVEAMLKQNRYDTDEARQLAQEAKYEAAHAIYLHQRINQLKKEDRDFEDVLLAAETPLRTVAGALDITPRFDTGFDTSVKELVSEIERREGSASHTADAMKRQESEITNLKQQVASMEGRLGSLTEAEKTLQTRLNEQKQQEETVARVATMFSRDEGNVIRDGNNIIVRLYGLSFPVGRNTIDAQFFPLLTKVQDAIKKFPGCQVAIEGHTDSQGSDETNQRLSESRADAVASYIKANIGANVPVASQGYGESRPVASNDTFEGRAKNRRIDVVIVPSWAIVGSR
jgi:outer membrane protein OmpA-like peptidoglycan-associated protein